MIVLLRDSLRLILLDLFTARLNPPNLDLRMTLLCRELTDNVLTNLLGLLIRRLNPPKRALRMNRLLLSDLFPPKRRERLKPRLNPPNLVLRVILLRNGDPTDNVLTDLLIRCLSPPKRALRMNRLLLSDLLTPKRLGPLKPLFTLPKRARRMNILLTGLFKPNLLLNPPRSDLFPKSLCLNRLRLILPGNLTPKRPLLLRRPRFPNLLPNPLPLRILLVTAGLK